MTASQHESLFQPTSSGRQSFPRFSNVIQDRKPALLERIRLHGDHCTRWAADSIMHRGSKSLPDGTLSLTKICPGYWISSLIENSPLRKTVSFPQAHLYQFPLPVIGYWIHLGGKVSRTPNSSSYIGRGFPPSKICLRWMRATLVQCGKTLQYYPRGSPTFFPPRSITSTLPIPLEIGQVWHVLTSEPLMGSPGTTFSIVYMLHPSTPGAVPTIDVYS